MRDLPVRTSGNFVIVGDPYFRYPAYRHRYAPAYFAYPPTYGMICGYDSWDRWVRYPR
jgi:hypothetical protein